MQSKNLKQVKLGECFRISQRRGGWQLWPPPPRRKLPTSVAEAQNCRTPSLGNCTPRIGAAAPPPPQLEPHAACRVGGSVAALVPKLEMDANPVRCCFAQHRVLRGSWNWPNCELKHSPHPLPNNVYSQWLLLAALQAQLFCRPEEGSRC